MQFADLDLPPQPAEDSWLKTTNDRSDVEIVVPLSVIEDGVSWVIGAMIFSDDAVSMIYHNSQQWELFTEYGLENDIRVYIDDLVEPEVGVVGKDSRILSTLAEKFAQKILDQTGMGFAPYTGPELADGIETARQQCDCSAIGDKKVRRSPGISGLESERFFLCSNCTEIHGLEYEGRKVSNEEAFNANWLLEGDSVDGFYDTDEEADFLLFSTGDEVGKLEHVIAHMNSIGGSTSSSFSSYRPDYHRSLVYVKDERNVVGYLTWAEEIDETLSLQQLFTREGFRRQGIASTLVTAWDKHFCDDDIFYAEEPNEKSRNLLRKMGYYQGEPKAIDHYLLRGVGNEWEEGKERADSVAGFQEGI